MDVLPPPPLAEMVTLVEALTALVVTVNPALVAPAGTVTPAGTVATAVLLLDSVTASPPLGAAADSNTVACEVPPPVRVAGFSTSEVTDGPAEPGGTTVRTAVLLTPAPVAVIVTFVVVLTTVVWMLKPPVVEPWGTVTVAGTVATLVLLLVRKICVSVGAAEPIVTTPVEPEVELPVVAGLSVSEAGAICGVSVSWDCKDTPFAEAVMTTDVFDVTALVGRLRTADGLPACTVTEAGGVAAGELLERLTTSPPVGALPLSRMVI